MSCGFSIPHWYIWLLQVEFSELGCAENVGGLLTDSITENIVLEARIDVKNVIKELVFHESFDLDFATKSLNFFLAVELFVSGDVGEGRKDVGSAEAQHLAEVRNEVLIVSRDHRLNLAWSIAIQDFVEVVDLVFRRALAVQEAEADQEILVDLVGFLAVFIILEGVWLKQFD